MRQHVLGRSRLPAGMPAWMIYVPILAVAAGFALGYFVGHVFPI